MSQVQLINLWQHAGGCFGFPTQPQSPGVGIGLSLVARFAALHGGRAWVEDRKGGGSSFRVFLPDETTVDLRQAELTTSTN